MALVASSIPHSVRQASFSESSNDLRGGSTYATQNDEFADSRRASRQQVVNRGTYAICIPLLIRYRNELEAFGLIEVENTITSGGGVAKYSFPDEPVPTAEAEEILITRLINNNNKAMNFKKERNDGNAGKRN